MIERDTNADIIRIRSPRILRSVFTIGSEHSLFLRADTYLYVSAERESDTRTYMVRVRPIITHCSVRKRVHTTNCGPQLFISHCCSHLSWFQSGRVPAHAFRQSLFASCTVSALKEPPETEAP